MFKIAVILAAYNGLKYLPQQLESIFQQKNVQVDIFISVDISTDGTEEFLENLAKLNSQLKLLPFGERYGGAAKNFFHLLKNVNFDIYDYVSLSDQDDIWESDKLERGVHMLEKHNAVGYSSNVTAFWEGGRTALVNKAQPQADFDYLFEAAGPGCTYILTRKFAKEIQEFLTHASSSMDIIDLHDWFIYAYARSKQYKWYIDVYSSMRYRQHGTNQVGANSSVRAALHRISLIKTQWYRHQICNISKVLKVNDNSIVNHVIEHRYTGNLYLLFNINKLRRRLRDKFAFALALLFNLF
ncbi:glycosyltransferase [Aeromonas veronii]